MAGDWIKMRGNLWDDPRVSSICDMTDQSEVAVIGSLYWLWATADQHTESGFMPGLTLRQIDRKTGVSGIAQALVEIGWIKEEPQGILICNFEEHNGASAKKRCQTAKRVANHRSGNDEVTHPSLQEEQTSVSSALAREEKRREEINTEPTALVVSPPEVVETDLTGQVVKLPDRRIPCPADRLLEVFHAECPTLPAVIKVNDKRRQHLTARWREVDVESKFSSSDDGIEIFRAVFKKVNASDFLSGRSQSNGRRWKASFDWIFESSTNFLKVCEGHYDNEQNRRVM
jgi:hypothetical protein